VRSYSVAFLVFSALHAATAQNANTASTASFELHGKVVCVVGNRPIGGATIEARFASDTTVLSRAVSAADGGFRVPLARPGRYRVLVRALGYAPRSIPPVAVSVVSPTVDIGSV